MGRWRTVVIFVWLLQCVLAAKYEGCKTPQFLDYGKSGIIHCFFYANFTAVFWYDSENIVDDEPIVTLINSVKLGRGYKSGDFDITSNGSLLISNVGVDHGKTFTVSKFTSFDEDPTIFVVAAVVTGVIADGCDSPQYLEYGREGIVHCHIQADFDSILWYNSTETVFDTPIVAYSESVKSGRGYESREFDVFSNGSLVIHDVRTVHEHYYTVAKFTSLNEDPTFFEVRVIITVKSPFRGPVIEKCESLNTTCYLELDGPSAVNCSVRRARPAVSLKWLIRTGYGDRNISSEVNSISDDVTFTSSAVTSDGFAYSPVLSLLVCQADFVPGVLQRNESLVLVQNSERNLSSVPSVIKYVPRDSTLELECTTTNFSFVVWKRSASLDNNYQNLMFAISVKNYVVTEYQDHFNFGKNGSLVLHHIDLQHDGFYICIYGDGITDGMTKYKVVTYVKPVPEYPVVEGCNYQHHCTLVVHRKGNLTCTMLGIRPEVKLEWNASNETSSGEISFFDHTYMVTKIGETFNIQLTSSYSVISVARVTVKCGVSGPGSVIFPLTSTVDLLFSPVKQVDDASVSVIIYMFPVFFILAVSLSCGALFRKVHYYKKKQTSASLFLESTRILLENMAKADKKALKKRFLHQIKHGYKRLYNANQPVPFIRDRLLCVDSVFVKVCLEKLTSLGKAKKMNAESQEQNQGIERESAWVKLDSYTDIVNDVMKTSTRLIMEGEPGYGKSTIALQMAYDWCNNESYLGGVEIFIVLQLRQLAWVSSIHQAIKHFILPWNSQITEGNIQEMLSESKSVMIVLDGFDEYPLKDRDSQNYVMKIITGEKFEKEKVILTTRSSVLPKKCAPQTQRIRLTGFDDNARDEYIRKAVVGDDETAAENIKQCISESFALKDLCQTPFFFVNFAHLCQESQSERFQNINSVTSLFQCMISCILTGTEMNLKQLEAIDKHHGKLDKEAFEALKGNNQQLHWQNNKLLERLGRDVYDQYVRAGILVEEEVPDISTDKSDTALNCTHFRKVTTVRFYHNLFCEWYAAHHLKNMISKFRRLLKRRSGLGSAYSYNHIIKGVNTHTLIKDIWSLLDEIKPLHLQYIYRFASGLSIESAVTIAKYLQDKGYKKNLAILCILEQVEKVENVLDSIRSLCSTDIFIIDTNTALQQKCTIEFLKIASNNKIPISKVGLIDSFKKVDLSERSIQLQSNFRLPALTTLKELEIRDKGNKLTVEEFEDISKYLAGCTDLQKLLFSHYLLPQSFSLTSLSDLNSDHVKVVWFCTDKLYRLDCKSGKWEELHNTSPTCASHSHRGNRSRRRITAKKEEVHHLQPMPTTFRYLSSQLGNEWRDVGRILQLQESTLDVMAIDDICTPEPAYRMLIHWKQLMTSKATIVNLIKALEEAGRKDLAEDVHNLETLKGVSPEATIRSLPELKMTSQGGQSRGGNAERQKRKFHEDSMELTLPYLSRNLGAEWLDVGRRLLLADADLFHIKANCTSRQDAIYQMLYKWRMQKGCGATYDVLSNSLKDAGRADLAEEFQKRTSVKIEEFPDNYQTC